MAITIAVILVATIALAALEVWLFWRLGELDDGRRSQGRSATVVRAMTLSAAASAAPMARPASTERRMCMGNAASRVAFASEAGDSVQPDTRAPLSALDARSDA